MYLSRGFGARIEDGCMVAMTCGGGGLVQASAEVLVAGQPHQGRMRSHDDPVEAHLKCWIDDPPGDTLSSRRSTPEVTKRLPASSQSVECCIDAIPRRRASDAALLGRSGHGTAPFVGAVRRRY